MKVDSVHRDDKHRFSKPRRYDVAPGDLGENITTDGLDLFTLPTGTILYLGDSAVIKVTGLRDPFNQINKLRKGMLKEVVWREDDGTRPTGVVRPSDPLTVALPPEPHEPLGLV